VRSVKLSSVTHIVSGHRITDVLRQICRFRSLVLWLSSRMSRFRCHFRFSGPLTRMSAGWRVSPVVYSVGTVHDRPAGADPPTAQTTDLQGPSGPVQLQECTRMRRRSLALHNSSGSQ